MPLDRARLTLAALVASLALPLAALGAPAQADALAGRALTLQECVSLSLRQNPAAAIAQQNLAAGRERIGEVRGGSYPTFRFSAAYTYTEPGGGAVAPAPDVYDNRFSLRQTLYDAGQTASLVDGARHGARALESDQRTAGLDIVLNVQASFFEVLRRGDFIEIARETERSARKHVEQAQGLYEEGLAPRSDVIKAEVQAANARLEIIKAENAWLLAKAGLSAAMGLPVTTELTLIAPETFREPPLPTLPEALLEASARRPELAAIKARQAAADAAIALARGGFSPTVSLDASYGWQQSEFLPRDTKWSVGVTVGIPVFERRVARARVGQAVAGRSGLEAAGTQALRKVELEVEQARLLLKEARERRALTQKILEQAETDNRVSEGRYQEGLGTMLELLDARTALTQAAANVVIARYDSALAGARLERALGAGLPEETQ